MRRPAERTARISGLLAAVLLTAGCASPGAQRTPTPSHVTATQRSPQTHVFTSAQYHFQVTLPAGWSGVDAEKPWDGKALQGVSSPQFADFADSATERVFTIGAAPVAKGTQLSAWRAAVLHGVAAACVDAKSVKQTVFGGEPALTWSATCPETHPVKYVAVHGASGYVAIFEPSGSITDAADQRVFDPILRSIRFTD